MIGIYDGDGDRLSVTYNGLTTNSAADAKDDTFELNAVTTIQPSEGVQESRPDRDGVEVYQARKQMMVVRLDYTIRAQSLAALYDKKRALAHAFDPAEVWRENQSVNGFIALDFSVPTGDTVNYPTGLVPSRYYARPRQTPIPADSMVTGDGCFATVEMLIADPRRYLQTADTLAGAGTANNRGDVPTYPTLTVTMAGAGSAAYTVSCDPALSGIATSSLVLNLSGCVAADVITVDMAARTILKNGVDAPTLYVSGDYFPLEAGSNTVAYANATNATSSLSWRRAWSA